MVLVLGIALMGGGFDIALHDANAAAEDVDLEVQSVTVDAPESATVAVPFNVTVNAMLRNNGPFGPVDDPADIGLSTPADCTKEPEGPFELFTASLEAGATIPASVTWSVTCSGAGVREFRGFATALSGFEDVYIDPNNDNNFGESTVSVTITSAPTAESGADGLPSSGGRPPDSSDPWFARYVAMIAAISAAAVALALGGGYARRRPLR